jgi:lysophospholipase L1-like esterase
MSIAVTLLPTGKSLFTTPRRLWLVSLFSVMLAFTMLSLGRCDGPLEADPRIRLSITLPPVIYAVPGVDSSIYFDNIVLTKEPERFRFTVDADLGTIQPLRWTVTPTKQQIGDHPLVVTARDEKGNVVASARTIMRVVDAEAGSGRSIKLLLVGDSLTQASHYPNEIARLLTLPGNPNWTMLGTHHPSAAKARVNHEGYGGWTWERFSNHYEPHPDPAQKKYSSPFVFLGTNGMPELDVHRYFYERLAGQRPDFITILLGINDVFHANPDNPELIEQRITSMLKQADLLLAAFRRAAPQAEIGICLTPPPNSRESGFVASYKGKYHRWGWKRIQFRLVQRQIEHFSGRENEHIFLVPTATNLDPTIGYAEDNGVHPNRYGYSQIGASVYSWLKWRMEQRSTPSMAHQQTAEIVPNP